MSAQHVTHSSAKARIQRRLAQGALLLLTSLTLTACIHPPGGAGGTNSGPGGNSSHGSNSGPGGSGHDQHHDQQGDHRDQPR
ncbi:hypothetical protein [Oceanobacter mangrovi]|uniref:hypothetical protein n=1 Tax=Oceanobacter mangrovi TaxID=2862510 RepID=UPI001C8EE396|nr:hypothetical protein [Oceanobacter mangrovi]